MMSPGLETVFTGIAIISEALDIPISFSANITNRAVPQKNKQMLEHFIITEYKLYY